jgi:DNA-binding transcriptional ArsR family regulator
MHIELHASNLRIWTVFLCMQWLCRKSPPCCLAASLAEWNGKPLNVTAIARRMGVTRPTARVRIRKLENEGLIILLPFHGKGRQLLYLRDSFQGYWVHRIMRRIREIIPDASFSWWKTGRVRQIDMLACFDGKCIGLQISENEQQNRGWWPLLIAHQRGLIQRGYLLHIQARAFTIRRNVFGLPLHFFCDEMEDWIQRRPSAQDVIAAVRVNNLREIGRGPFFA